MQKITTTCVVNAICIVNCLSAAMNVEDFGATWVKYGAETTSMEKLSTQKCYFGNNMPNYSAKPVRFLQLSTTH